MDTWVTVPIFYTCHGCGITDREFRVRERLVNEDVVDWMHYVQDALGFDHQRTSPMCSSGHCDLKIPMANKDARIGEAVRQ